MKAPLKTYAFYNGKLKDMSYVPNPKQRYQYAALRISDNGFDGFVIEGSKVFAISKYNPRRGKQLIGPERDAVLAQVDEILMRGEEI